MQKVLHTELALFAEELLVRLAKAKSTHAATLVTLSGDLGAGKTTLVQALALALGVKESVSSPTYVIMKSYTIAWGGFTKLVHIDLYRLEKPEELAALNLEMVFSDPGNLVCIEWPERAGDLLPHPNLALHLSSAGASESERFVEIF